ncbi:hypothetical protein IWX63_003220 [Arthrobacter sp. CAN_A2]|uniref:hypothetical protein n=1 Tax=Arthrobacter sp. CAN_A2 TaxID=2787718 RepID=UPI0018EF861E
MTKHTEQTTDQHGQHHDQQHGTRLAAQEAGITSRELWWHYYSVGGNGGRFELDAYLEGMYPLPVGERNLIALVLNELIDDLPQRRRAPFVDETPAL